jgi:dTDP-glucose pyrophosphorylase
MTPGLGDVLVRAGTPLRQALEGMTRSGKQVALVVDAAGRLLGLATDGDVRKAILRGAALDTPVDAAMNRRPVVGAPGMAAAEAAATMRGRGIRHLPLVDAGGVVVDLLLLDDLLAPPVALPAVAVVMAGGEGRRLRPLTAETPKPLLQVGGRAILDRLVERLRASGFVDLVVAVRHRAERVRAHLGDGGRLGVRVRYVEEATPLGTMGALALAREHLRAPFLVVNADILTRCDFGAMWEFHRAQAGVGMTVGVCLHQVDIPYGEFTLRGARVARIEEKPRKEFPVNAGIYVVEPSVVDLVPADRTVDAPDLIRLLLDKGQEVAAFVIREYWLDVGRPADLEQAQRDAAEGRLP